MEKNGWRLPQTSFNDNDDDDVEVFSLLLLLLRPVSAFFLNEVVNQTAFLAVGWFLLPPSLPPLTIGSANGPRI